MATEPELLVAKGEILVALATVSVAIFLYYRSFSVVAKLASNFLNWSLVLKVWSPWRLKWAQLGWLSELFCDVYNIFEDTSAPRRNEGK